jgi:uncharacterized protein YccT (UPF0319 family)
MSDEERADREPGLLGVDGQKHSGRHSIPDRKDKNIWENKDNRLVTGLNKTIADKALMLLLSASTVLRLRLCLKD